MKPTLPRPPRELSPAAKRLWKTLYDASVMDPQAILLLDLMMQRWDRLQEARAILKREGLQLQEMTAAGCKKFRPHPMLQVERDALASVVRCFRALGYDELPEGIR